MGLLHDLRFAVRLIAKERWFTAVAVAALALGIGVNATVFTLVNAVLIRGLPFKDSGQLYMLGPKRQDGRAASLSISELRDWRAQSKTFAGLAGFTNSSMNLADDRGMPEQARGVYLTANAFRVLGQQPLLGRDFAEADEQRGAERVAIIGYTIWKNRYGGDPSVLGHPVRVNGDPAIIVGVMPDGMMFPMDSTMWMAFVPTEAQERRDNRALAIFGRVRGGVNRSEAQAEMDAIAGRMATQYPDSNKQFPQAIIQTFNERFNGGDIRQVFLSMMGAVGFVLLIACANVANLLLSRAANRSREIALRIALGASRWRVVRQLLVESILLGCLGGVFGLMLAYVGVRLFDSAVSVDVGKPYWIQFTMDWTVFGFLAAICVVTGIVFGLAPALQVSKTSVNEVLKEGGRGTSGSRRARWLSGTMVVIEIALTIVLLVGAGLMVRSFMKVYSQDLGIRSDYLLTMRLQLPSTKYPNAAARQQFFERLAPRLEAVPGAESTAITTSVPPEGGGQRDVEIEGRPIAAGTERRVVTSVTISPTFFDTVGATLIRGRAFGVNDGLPGSETAIVNARFASEFFPGEDPIGRRIRFPDRESKPGTPPAVWRTIVGISPALQHGAPRNVQSPSVVYVPLRQEPTGYAVLLVRSRVDPAVMVNSIRREVQAIDQDQPVYTVRTVAQMLNQQQWPYRVFGTLFGVFALIALILAAVGLYAVMAYSVTQRTQEIGVRMALGAAGSQVSWLILRRGIVQLVIGLSIGLAGAWFASRALRPLLFQVAPNDPTTLAGISLLLTIVALAACLIPARRATRLDPLVALRRD
jgi:putative ABC transport system permease protein